MLKNQWKIAWRNILKHKGFSLINVTGLAVGLACVILITLWVVDELSYNRSHRNYDRIYQVLVNREFDGVTSTDRSSPFPMAGALENRFPGVDKAVVLTTDDRTTISVGDKHLTRTQLITSASFFEIFSHPVLYGTTKGVLNDPRQIVITRSTALALFGNVQVVNKTIRVNNAGEHQVAAVIEDLPDNSTLRFDIVVPYNFSDPRIQRTMQDWVSSYTSTYVLLSPEVAPQQVNGQINQLMRERFPQGHFGFFLDPMSNWRLYSDFRDGKNVGGLIAYVKLFSIIAIIILIIACVNFMNLSTARSESRSREVGIRKTLGSDRSQLLVQFYLESFLMTLSAFLLAILIVLLVLPSFNLLVQKNMYLPFTSIRAWLSALSLIAVTTLFAGSYPALYLSSFQPVRVLKGTYRPGRQVLIPRKILVVGQFAITLMLIAATLVIYQQLQYVKHRDMGYNPNNLIMVSSTPEKNRNIEAIRNELFKSGLVESVARTSSPVTEVWNFTPAPDWQGKAPNSNILMAALGSEAGFARTLGVKVLEGRDFENTPGDSSAMLLNQMAVQKMGLKNPVGMQMRYNNRTYQVIGVIDNIIMSSPYTPVEPLMMLSRSFYTQINVRLKTGVKPQEALPQLQSIFTRLDATSPFDYRFADQEFARKFHTEELISILTNLFAGLAILISCLGLAGLVTLSVQRRFKEMGIRKVLGASVKNLLLLIATEFIWLLAIAFLIAVPLAWWFMHDWLHQYEYRIKIHAGYFIASGVIVFLVALAVVILNTYKSAITNPVKNLRTE